VKGECSTFVGIDESVVSYWARMAAKFTLMMVPEFAKVLVVCWQPQEDAAAPVAFPEGGVTPVGQESWQLGPQLGVPSHCSPLSRTPSPQREKRQFLRQALAA
jgi:hypothetical protein